MISKALPVVRTKAAVVQDFWKDENGQGVTEYMLLLSVCIVGTTTLGKRLLGVLDTGIARLGGQLEQDLKTGREPLSVWKN